MILLASWCALRFGELTELRRKDIELTDYTETVDEGFMAWPQRGRYSRRRGAQRLPERLRQRILRRDPVCKLQIPNICTGRSEQVDHIIDAADGGPDEGWNLQGCCAPCHRYKSARRSAERTAGALATR
jgi:integrase